LYTADWYVVELTLIGVGRAGGRLADAFVKTDEWLVVDPVAGVCAVDTSRAYLQQLSEVPDAQRHLLGTEQAKGHGVGFDSELAATIAVEERDKILTIGDGLPIEDSDAILTLSGLGGGTGAGMTPIIAETVGNEYDIPVYSLSILPHRRTSPIQTLNAARSLRSLRQRTDHVLLYDNDLWAPPDPDESLYQEVNTRVVTAVGTLFGAIGQLDIDQSDKSTGPTKQADGVLSKNALSGLGFATDAAVQAGPTEQNQGLFTRLWPPQSEGPEEKSPETDELTATMQREKIANVLNEAASPPYTLPVALNKELETELFIIAPESCLPGGDISSKVLPRVEGLDSTRLHVCPPSPMGVRDRISAVCLLTASRLDRVSELIEEAIALQNDPSWVKDLEVSEQYRERLESRLNGADTTSADGGDDLHSLF